MQILLKRAYATPAPADGARFLVDRLWPRGVKKEKLMLAAWLKDAAPSSALRRWFGHSPARWEEFQRRYRDELAVNPEVLQPIFEAAKRGQVTLVYSSKDEDHNQAVVLRDFLLEGKESRRRAV